MSQNKSQAEQFAMTGWRVSGVAPQVEFHFRCSRFGDFSETVQFPPDAGDLRAHMDQGLPRLLSLLQVALGVSYYKCAAAQHILLPAHMQDEPSRAFATSLYTEGLAEFYIRAGLPFPPKLNFSTPDDSTGDRGSPAKDTRTHKRQALVAFGGGKDSYVAAAIADQAGVPYQLCSIVMSDKVRECIQRTSTAPVLFTDRALDPKLREVNRAGAFNGHVPITAINSLILVIYGRLTGAEYVIFANERSADEPTIEIDGVTANHQYSKSSFFEDTLRCAITAADPAAPEYFSVLRPFSEIWIASKFSQLDDPLDRFTSCNRNFLISGEDAPRWCGDCAKCAFTSLLLAPFISPTDAGRIFPENFLNSEGLLPIYRQLCGLTDQKPWDCVGTINECQATLFRLSAMPGWQETLVVRTLLPEILKLKDAATLERDWLSGLETASRHFVPDEFMKAADAL